MVHPAIRALGRAAAILAVAALAAGCATRYDAGGHEIYVWQFGQDTSRDIDYSNPRMPILPRQRPSMELWPAPSPYEFNDLSRWSLLQEPAPLGTSMAARIAGVGDNAQRVACTETTARLALPAPSADDRSEPGVRAVL